MSAYRIYQIDGAGRFSKADWIEASDDEEALKTARERFSAGVFELWQNRRLIARIDANGNSRSR